MSDKAMRPWYRIHRSTLGVIAVVVAWMIFINIPGDRALRDSRRFHHGWPYLYFEREGAARSWWSFAGTSSELHVDALLLNILAAFCIAALAAFVCEIWIRRFGSLLRFSIASMLVVTALLAVIMGLVVRDVHDCYRQQQTLEELAKLGSVRAMRQERKFDWFRSLFGSNFDGTIQRIEVDSWEAADASVPDLSALDGLKTLNLTGMRIDAADVEQLSTAPKLENLFLDLRAIRDSPEKALDKISELSISWIQLRLEGDWVDDEIVAGLSPESLIDNLMIKYSRVTGGMFPHLSKMNSLELLWIEGCQVRDADFSPLAQAPNLKSVTFVGCNLSPADEEALRALWPEGRVHVSTVPHLKAKAVAVMRN